MATEEEIDRVWQADAGAHLFNGITKMNLFRRNDSYPILFSQRKRLTREVIAMILDQGYTLEGQ